jgi:site-specific recombinase XerD
VKTTFGSLNDLTAMAASWELHLEAANLSPKTIRTYLDSVRQLHDHLVTKGMPTAVGAVTREHVESFVVAVRERTSASTAATRYRGLQQFFKWLQDEGEITRNPMERMRPPKLEERPVPVIPDDDLRALFRVCAGKTFDARRDTALLRLFVNTGARLAEMANLTMDDLDLHGRELYVVGKGRKGRSLPLGPKAVKDLDRYARARSRHKDSELPWLWLGPKGRLSDSGIAQMLKRRSRQAGIDPPIHPHQFRHTFSHLWLSAGGGEHDLSKINGWSSLQMVGRYASSAATERAKAAHGRIDPGADL